MAFYVDAVQGDDARAGTSPEASWRTLGRVSREAFAPGAQVLLRRGQCWNEPLLLRGKGTAERPITLGAYGEGPRPRINGGEAHAISAEEPISAWRITGLELTSTNDLNPTHKITGGTCGVYLSQGEPCARLTIDDCVIHHTSGPGIHLLATGDEKAVFADTLIEHCRIHDASCGIQFHASPLGTAYFQRFRIAHVVVHDIGGDGIVPFCGTDGVIEYCTAYRTGQGVDPKDHSPVGIWYAFAVRCIIQYCESYDNRTGGRKADGGGFDLDGGCIDCILQYNYSHDNEGSGYLVCSFDPEKWPCRGCICRYNLSVNDGIANQYAAVHFWQLADCRIYNNTLIVRNTPGLRFNTWARNLLIANNIFYLDTPEHLPIVQTNCEMGENEFRNNLYYHLRGTPRFDINGQNLMGVDEFAKLTGGQGERHGDPRFTDLAARDVHLRPGSPGRRAGLRIAGMGSRDYYGYLLPEEGPVEVGCAEG
jgi:hypothetical protein